MIGYKAIGDIIVCAGYPGEQHSLKEYVTPDQVMVGNVRESILGNPQSGNAIWDCWDYVCKRVRYPLDHSGRFTDTHEINAFGMQKIRSNGEFFQMPYQTLTVGIGDCFDTSSLLASILRKMTKTVHVVLGTFSGKEEIDHAWVEVGSPPVLLETTLKNAKEFRFAKDMPYEPQVRFNESEILSRKPDVESLFCNVIALNSYTLREIRRCWQCHNQ